MVKVNHVAHLVDNHIVDYLSRRHGQPPIKGELTIGIARSPSCFTIRDLNRTWLHLEVTLINGYTFFY